ncbi:M10 family metallopeptidase [Roseivivax sediminis]|nr:M10 family metallopeptidase [Roseivivax sediminis]
MCTICDSRDYILRKAALGQDIDDMTGAATLGLVAETLPATGAAEEADAPAGTGTGYAVSVDGIFEGEIATGSDTDWIRVELEADETYVLLAWGTGGEYAGLNDTVLTLRGADGTELAFNDDISGHGNAFSAITYTAVHGGTHFLEVASYDTETGTYRVVATPEEVSAETAAVFLTEYEWGAPMPLRFDPGPSGVLTVSLTGLTEAAQTLARWALEAWESVSALSFTEVTGSADITFDDENSGAFAGPDAYWLSSGINTRSSVNVGKEWVADYGTTYDSYSLETYLHEIGHALGLGHMGPYSGSAIFGTGNIFANDSTLLSVMSYFHPDENPNVAGDHVIALTPMLADILAIEALYGPAEAHPGDTVWGANSNVGGTLGTAFGILYDSESAPASFWSRGRVTFTIHDTGGDDLLDLSTVTEAQRIDLRSGAASDAGGVAGGLVIATTTVIEAARTGSGDDWLRGNSADNRLDAGAGDDTVLGGAGTDVAVFAATLAGATAVEEGAGVRVTSAAGSDYFEEVERFAFSDATVSLSQLLTAAAPEPEPEPAPESGPTPQREPSLEPAPAPEPVPSPEPEATPEPDPAPDPEPSPEPAPAPDLSPTPQVVVEPPLGSDPADSGGASGGRRIAGTDGADTLTGTEGDDTILGGEGLDSLFGGGGDDEVAGSGGNDTIHGGDGNDNIGGGFGADGIHAGDGSDTVGGGRGEDTIFGGFGHDIVNGGFGADELDGGSGNDTSGAGDGTDRVRGGVGDDSLGGGGGIDTLSGGRGNDRIGAGDGDDLVDAGDGADFAAGGAGNDRIDGGAGADTLNGGLGDDTLIGGSGRDVFVFNNLTAAERDVIADFDPGSDLLRLSGIDNAPGSGHAGYLDALSPAAVAGGTLLSYGGHEIFLTDVSLPELGPEDFAFS